MTKILLLPVRKSEFHWGPLPGDQRSGVSPSTQSTRQEIPAGWWASALDSPVFEAWLCHPGSP